MMYIHFRYLFLFFFHWETFEIKLEEKIKTHFTFNSRFVTENRAIYEIILKKMYICTARLATDNDITRRMRIACWIPKAINPHSGYVILTAFPLQQLLHEPASMWHTCIACPIQCAFIIGKSHTWNTITWFTQIYVSGKEDSRMLKPVVGAGLLCNWSGEQRKATRINRERILDRNARFRI